MTRWFRAKKGQQSFRYNIETGLAWRNISVLLFFHTHHVQAPFHYQCILLPFHCSLLYLRFFNSLYFTCSYKIDFMLHVTMFITLVFVKFCSCLAQLLRAWFFFVSVYLLSISVLCQFIAQIQVLPGFHYCPDSTSTILCIPLVLPVICILITCPSNFRLHVKMGDIIALGHLKAILNQYSSK